MARMVSWSEAMGFANAVANASGWEQPQTCDWCGDEAPFRYVAYDGQSDDLICKDCESKQWEGANHG